MGIIFDLPYTQAIVDAVSKAVPVAHGTSKSSVERRRAALTSLLLHGTGHLTRLPRDFGRDAPAIRAFESEGLIKWIPPKYALRSHATLRFFFDALEAQSGRTRDASVRKSEVLGTAQLFERQLRSIAPLHDSNLGFFGCKRAVLDRFTNHVVHDDAYPLAIATYGQDVSILDATPEADYHSYCDLVDGWPKDRGQPRMVRMVLASRPGQFEIEHSAAAYLDAAIATLSMRQFASETSLPIRTLDARSSEDWKMTLEGDDEYQLVRIHFQEMQYPVIESPDDVLRLRDSPHLETYREVIAEYSRQLHEQIGLGRQRVLHDFRRDLRQAVASLRGIKTWERRADISFYVSIPLAVIGHILHLPLSDIAMIPLTLYLKAIAHRRRHEHDWLMFGRHGLLGA